MSLLPRLLPNRPLPDYSYVPGRWPHPHSQPGRLDWPGEIVSPNLISSRWQEDEPFILGIDLWNHGFYWEAHEAWEWMWNAAGRKGTEANFFKGLIQLAVAGVKAREGRTESVQRHARRGAELFAQIALELNQDLFFGLSLRFLTALAQSITNQPPLPLESDDSPVRIVFSEVLRPV